MSLFDLTTSTVSRCDNFCRRYADGIIICLRGESGDTFALLYCARN